MSCTQIIVNRIEQIPENELIFASKLYGQILCGEVTESAYYQVLGRMCKAGKLCKIAKGTYYRPKASKYGIIPLSQKEVVATFTAQERGTVVGHSLYNSLRLTTQVPKTTIVLSSALEQQTKNIGNVSLHFCNLVYTPEVAGMIHMMEVLQNFGEIQDLNYTQFIKFCEQFSETYSDEIFAQVCQQIRYQKKTISFLRNILMYYQVPNNLGGYLSSLSEYKHPTMEEIYEVAHLS